MEKKAVEKCYKLLNVDMTSHGPFLDTAPRHGDCKWTIGEWKEAYRLGHFYAPGGYHGYEYPLLAMLHAPLHIGRIQNLRLFKAEAAGEIAHDGQMILKARRMRVIQETPLPAVSMGQRIAYAIHCAKAVYTDREWNEWADAWLSGADRSERTATEVWDWTQRVAEEKQRAGAAKREAWAAVCAALAAMEADPRWAARRAAEAAEYANKEGVDLIACAGRAMEVVGAQ